MRPHAMLRRIVGLKDDLFVVIQPEPFEAFDDRARRFLGRALQVGVFDAQQNLPPTFRANSQLKSAERAAPMCR